MLVGTVLIGLWSSAEALEERRSAAAARDLQMAAMTVATADLVVATYGGEPQLPALESSVEELRGGHDLALHALPPDQAGRARDLLREITACGLRLLASDGSKPVVHDHQELQYLLDSAARNAATEAAEAERQAVLAVFVAVFAVCLGGWLLVRSRYRSERERSRAEAQANAGRRLESLINDSPEIFLVIDRAGGIAYRSASADRLLDAAALSTEDIVALADGPEQSELREHLGRSDIGGVSDVFRLVGADHEPGWYEVRVSDLTDDDLVDGHVITARDITGEVRLRDELRRLANTDVLTGLPNRRVLQSAIEDAKAAVRGDGAMMALMTLDIDGFKVINDSLGHLAGDELLIEVAARLNRAIGPDDVVLRLGGDEFAVVVPRVTPESAAYVHAQRLLDVLREPFRLGERWERVRTSIGVAVTSDPEHAVALLSEADIAMYEAKRRGGDDAVFYEPVLESGATRATQITRALRSADFDAELSLVYQPIVDVDTSEIVALEALLRWTSPDLGTVTPNEFIPVAEASGEICRIGQWVLDSVCRQLAAWIESGIAPHITVSFNVSPLELAEDDFVSGVLAAARTWSISPERLVVEVTESTALEHTGLSVARLEQLRQAGIRISIDDFGSGYSNLGQLLTVPFDVIKIDRSLLLTLTAMRERAGGDTSGPCAIMEAIVSIAGILDAPVICEGVETERQRTSLQASGVGYVQGYLTGRPVPAESITPALRASSTTEVGRGRSLGRSMARVS